MYLAFNTLSSSLLYTFWYISGECKSVFCFSIISRNVVFIISRNGFSDNAKKAALGILKEQGKLIIDLTDHDLEVMVCAKKDGKEPSDYLLDKVEKLLMGVSI